MAEKTMVDINKIIKLRDQILVAIKIEKQENDKWKEGTTYHSYSLGKLHVLKEFEEKLNDLIIQG